MLLANTNRMLSYLRNTKRKTRIKKHEWPKKPEEPKPIVKKSVGALVKICV